ncbi:MAG: type IV pilin protein [Burkholderiales bacterium]|nr:type IV pilin protein [Burkholderiales bacterium]
MIVVAVVAILSVIAVPSYLDYSQRGKITEATATLSELRIRAERWFADNRTYVGDWEGNATAGARYFTYSCTKSATAFTCTATGTGGMTGFVYTINESNVKTSTFTGLSGWNNCATRWITKKGETC